MLFMHRKRKEMEMQQDSHEDLSCMSRTNPHAVSYTHLRAHET